MEDFVCCNKDEDGFKCAFCGYHFHYTCDYTTEEENSLFTKYYCINCKHSNKLVNIVKPDILNLKDKYQECLKQCVEKNDEIDGLKKQVQRYKEMYRTEHQNAIMLKDQFEALKKLYEGEKRKAMEMKDNFEKSFNDTQANLTNMKSETQQKYKHFERTLSSFYDEFINRAIKTHLEEVKKDNDMISKEKIRTVRSSQLGFEVSTPEKKEILDTSDLKNNKSKSKIWRY